MGRKARILYVAQDAFGDPWDIREERPTRHGWPLLMGWPHGIPRGPGGAGGPRAILTAPAVAYLESRRLRPAGIDLPLGRTAVKRLRRVLGHCWQADTAAWYKARVADLATLTLPEFARRHGGTESAAEAWRLRLVGKLLREPGWWRKGEARELLLSGAPRAYIAERLGVSVGAVGRLRWRLRTESPGSASAEGPSAERPSAERPSAGTT